MPHCGNVNIVAGSVNKKTGELIDGLIRDLMIRERYERILLIRFFWFEDFLLGICCGDRPDATSRLGE